MRKINGNALFITGVVVICTLLPILFFYFGYNYRVSSRVNLVKVPYVNQTVQPGIEITADMVSEISVPESFLVSDYYETIDDIIGMCVDDSTRIIEGSIFYKDLLTEC